MILTDFITYTWHAFKGNNRVPTSGEDKYVILLAIANRKQREWARDPNHRWRSLYDEREMGTIVAGTQTYDLDEDLIRPAEKVYVDWVGDGISEFRVVNPDQRYAYYDVVFFASSDPIKVTFVDTIASTSNLVGGTIRLPGYYMPDTLNTGGDTIPVDNPDWLIYATAAEMARNDAAKTDQFANLMGLANQEYEKMVDANQSVPYLQLNAVPYDNEQIGAEGE